MGKYYRLLEDLPGYPKGSIVTSGQTLYDIAFLRAENWVEEVVEKEPTLEDKFRNKYQEVDGVYCDKIDKHNHSLCYDLVQIAKAHYQANPEELFTGGLSAFENLCKVRGMVKQDDIKSINKRLGDLEAKSEKASKSDVKALAEYVRNKTEGLVKLEDVLRVFDEADYKVKKRIYNGFQSDVAYIRSAIEGMKGENKWK